MKRRGSQKIQEIDDSLKSELRAVDYTGLNFIEKDYSLVMDNSAFVKNVVVDSPLRSSEHRIILVKKGSVDYTLNYMEYRVSQGEVLMVPANYIINVESHSSDFNARVLSFRFSDTEYAGLVGYDVVKLRLGYVEEQVFDNFFQMMHQVLKSPTLGKHDFEHLVLSMLFRIQGLSTANNRSLAPSYGDRKQAVFSQFMQLVNATENAPRTVTYYAEQIGVSANYLSVAIKEKSDRTVMDWVNLRTATQIKLLLLDPSNLTIDQIAEKLDFSSTTQMIRVFKKLTGNTPLEYRKSAEEKRKKLQDLPEEP